MKHTELKKGQQILETVFLKIVKSEVKKTTKKTVVTSYGRHSDLMGSALFVYDEEKYAKIRTIENQILKLRRKHREMAHTLEMITFDEEDETIGADE